MKVIIGLMAGTVEFAIVCNDDVAEESLAELERANRNTEEPMDSIRVYDPDTTLSAVKAITEEV